MIELLLIHGVKFGLILSGLLMGVLLISQLINDYGFHFRAFLIGTAMITVLSTVIAAVAAALKWI